MITGIFHSPPPVRVFAFIAHRARVAGGQYYAFNVILIIIPRALGRIRTDSRYSTGHSILPVYAL